MAKKMKYWSGMVWGIKPQHSAVVRAANQKEAAELVRASSLYEFRTYWVSLDFDYMSEDLIAALEKIGEGAGVIADPRGANYYKERLYEKWPFSDEVVARYKEER